MARIKFTNSKFPHTKNEILSGTDLDPLHEEDFLIRGKEIPTMNLKKKRPRIVK